MKICEKKLSDVSENYIVINEKAKARLLHIDSHLNGNTFRPERISLLNNRITNNEENAYDCILSLESFATANGISNWFNKGDLKSLKNWFYVRGKLDYLVKNPPYNNSPVEVAVHRVLTGMYYLISDHSDLIKWYSNIDKDFDKKSVEDTKSENYWTQQFFLALRCEWDVLIDRCERILAAPPTTSRGKKFIPDYKFYLALAKGDIGEMERIVKELVTPKLIANRIELEDGYTADLICSPAVIYSKLAWRNGYEIVVDSPYIPKEWLPIAPLTSYEDPFVFMKNYPIPA